MTDEKMTGFDEVVEEMEDIAKEDAPEKPVFAKAPFRIWTVGEVEYRLKLTTSVIVRLEQVLKGSLLDAILADGIPKVSTTITFLQAAMQKFQHGMKASAVEKLYDEYLDEGKDQLDLLRDVVYPLMYDAGFFTAAQVELILKEMQNIDSSL